MLGLSVPLLELAADAAEHPPQLPSLQAQGLPCPHPIEAPQSHILSTTPAAPPPIFQGQPVPLAGLCELGWSLKPYWACGYHVLERSRLKGLSMNLSGFCLPSAHCSSPHTSPSSPGQSEGEVGARTALPLGAPGDSQLHHPEGFQVRWVRVSAVLRECCRHISARAPECRSVRLTQFEQPALAVRFEEGVGEVIAIVLEGMEKGSLLMLSKSSAPRGGERKDLL